MTYEEKLKDTLTPEQGNNDMNRKTYAIAIENSKTGQIERVENLPLLTLAQAQRAQSIAAQANIETLVINLNTQ